MTRAAGGVLRLAATDTARQAMKRALKEAMTEAIAQALGESAERAAVQGRHETVRASKSPASPGGRRPARR
ncbi:MAG: hypothetical protein ACRDOO_29125 [Actinomadura sp.]